MKWPKLFVVAGILVPFLCGCVILPRSGPVTPFSQKAQTSGGLIQSAQGPVQGSSVEQLVGDFLLACAAGANDDFAKARLYLEDTSVGNWDPGESVTIVESESGPRSEVEDNVALVSGIIRGVVDKNGIRTNANAGEAFEQKIILVRNKQGEWRISNPPNGIVISVGSFTASYMRRSLYFLAPDGTTLVADPRWFPRQQIVTHLVESLLQGPSPDLKDTVYSAIPAEVTLPISVPNVEEGVASIILSKEAGALDPKALAAIYWQFSRTLSGVSLITKTQLFAAEKPLQNTDPLTDPTLDQTTTVGIVEGAVVKTSLRDSVPQTVALPKDNSNYSFPAIGPTGGAPIVVLENDSRLLDITQTNSDGQEIPSAKMPSAPSVDRLGWVWTASKKNGEVLAAKSQEVISEIEIGENRLDSVDELRISLDGARAVLRGTRAGKPVAELYSVKREPDGKPIALMSGLEFSGVVESIDSVGWIDSTSYAVLGKLDNQQKIFIVQVGGGQTMVDAPPNTVGIVGGGADEVVSLIDEEDTLIVRTGSTWTTNRRGMKQFHYPG